jgi:hypothetical protein
MFLIKLRSLNEKLPASGWLLFPPSPQSASELATSFRRKKPALQASFSSLSDHGRIQTLFLKRPLYGTFGKSIQDVDDL